jgi:hypothetical protein
MSKTAERVILQYSGTQHETAVLQIIQASPLKISALSESYLNNNTTEKIGIKRMAEMAVYCC